jgi:hypothetical protein
MSRPVGTYDLFLVPAGNLTTPLTDLIIPPIWDGRVLYASQAVNCLATFILSLRDTASRPLRAMANAG